MNIVESQTRYLALSPSYVYIVEFALFTKLIPRMNDTNAYINTMSDVMKCCLHLVNDADIKILNFSTVSWAKVKQCCLKWKDFDTTEGKIASELLLLPVNEQEELPDDKSNGFHRKCYSKFTDKTRIAAAEKKNSKASTSKAKQFHDSSLSENMISKRIMRSDSIFSQGVSKKCVLPAVCVVCKTEKYIVDRPTGKRKKEKLAKCETNNNLLLEAAIAKNDEHLLIQIRDKDLIAIEMQYHRSCYKNYTKFLTIDKSAQPVDTQY